ncbi:Alpha/Beta hydrolase protein [Ilyonectria robusta]|uniref:Alpha/Beta hydrolase protein n=1 Tax=Ilyonectria robusta TaxID=1079257 RepID=UPI001E8E119C|nr:Alpha/Beta hydrolase protein [Ilyonectria robusta]KAH8684119.1 Alpha/Beta hydrolase protein [Ilyonectria robusta]
MTQLTIELEQGHLPNTCQYTARTRRGDYLVQVAWPQCWNENRAQPADDAPVSTIYLVDGNAYFFTAVDFARRLESVSGTRTVIVGVGYPVTNSVFDRRRGSDLTPPSEDGKYATVIAKDGTPMTGINYGGASDFLDVILGDIMPYVEGALFPDAPLQTSRKALYGHSYGGLFTLNALFTKPTHFDTFIAASPSIWFNHCSIVKGQETHFRERKHPANPAPRLLVTWGSEEQLLVQKTGESEAQFAMRLRYTRPMKMKDNALAMVARLEDCPSIRDIYKWEFAGEDHGSAAAVALQRGVMKFLLEDV